MVEDKLVTTEIKDLHGGEVLEALSKPQGRRDFAWRSIREEIFGRDCMWVSGIKAGAIAEPHYENVGFGVSSLDEHVNGGRVMLGFKVFPKEGGDTSSLEIGYTTDVDSSAYYPTDVYMRVDGVLYQRVERDEIDVLHKKSNETYQWKQVDQIGPQAYHSAKELLSKHTEAMNNFLNTVEEISAQADMHEAAPAHPLFPRDIANRFGAAFFQKVRGN
jgi:hypothetical protein